MAYQALYRKWRPLRFDDVIGQAHITETVKNEIKSNRLAHAYLFTGTRGTGKTTTAKILSRAVNCLSPIDGNPCNECEVCKAILAETCLDVQEIDAASNTGVDNIRDIISQVNYVATMGKYKVFIIDEVHMLSKGAFNALLKTLEEPPSHVIFILATTEVRQIPATILSRCQRFDFKTISIADICHNLRTILDGEHINADDDALEYVAYLGDGSMRDSLSILDQCLAFSQGTLTLGDVTDVVGAVDDSVLYEFALDVANNDTVSALERFNDCVTSGKNYDSIATGLLAVFREIIMYKISPDKFSVGKAKMTKLGQCAEIFDIPTLTRCINTLADCIASFKNFSSQRAVCECALIKLTTPEVNDDFSSVLARLSALEHKISDAKFAPIQACTQEKKAKEDNPVLQSDTFAPEKTETIAPALGESEAPPVSAEPVEKSDALQNPAHVAVAMWQDIKAGLAASGKITLSAYLYSAEAKEANGVCHIIVNDANTVRILNEKPNRDSLVAAICDKVGAQVKINITNDDYVEADTSVGDDIFASIGNMGKSFPDNFNIK